MTSKPISVNPGSVVCILGTVAFLLVLASTTGQLITYLTAHHHLFGLNPLFYVDAERNIPTFFSMFILLFASLLLSIITVLEKKQSASDVLHWAVLALGFLLMAADEMISLHEKLSMPTRQLWLSMPIRRLLDNDSLGIFYSAWVIPGIALLLVLAWFFLRFWLRLPMKTRLTFLIAAIIYIGGCIGFEIIGAQYAGFHGRENLTYSMIATVEESLEMAGIILFIWGLLVYIADNYKEVQFKIN